LTYTPTALDAGHTLVFMVSASNSAGQASVSSTATPVVDEAPSNSVAPSIGGGAPEQGVAVTASAGTWSGYPAPTFDFDFERCPDTSGSGCVSVQDSASDSYTPTSADTGELLRVAVTATNSAGQSTATSDYTPAVTAPPANTGVPTVTGTAQQDKTLDGSAGSWSGYPPPTLTYQWEDCDASGNNCTPVAADGNGLDYTATALDIGHTLELVVTATNEDGHATASSAPTAVVLIAPPGNTALPELSGKEQPGQMLSATTGTWTNSPKSYSYQWWQCDASGNNCAPALGTGSTYQVLVGDIGHTIRVTVVAANDGGQTAAISGASPVVTVAPPVNTTPPTIGGTPQQGATLSASDGSWTNSPYAFTYQWQQCDGTGNGCNDILGANASTYVPDQGDIGHELRVVVTATNSTGSTAATSGAGAAVLIAAPANTTPPQLGGSAQQGQQVLANDGAWDNSPGGYTYQWEQCDASGANCVPIPGANADSYVPTVGDVGHTLRVTVTADNAGGQTPATSGPSAVVAGLEASVPPPILQQSANLAPVTGSVLVKLPGSTTFVPVTTAIDVPVGSTIDATQGTVSLTVQLPAGTYETGQFYSGQFLVNQSHNGTLDATLSGGSFAGCSTKVKGGRGASSASAHKKSKTVVRKLWGSAHGNYKTKGRYGSASVSGTIWLTEDRCDGTYFFALKDTVIVVAYKHPHKKHKLKQGHHILIPAH
jgi:hypothetical protein